MKIEKLPLLLALMLPLCCASCRHEHCADDDFERTDSLLEKMGDLIMLAPVKADSQLSAMQRNVTDSAAWYTIQVFRATARLHAGDSVTGRRMYEGVQAWCAANPGNEAVEGRLYNHYGVSAGLRQNSERSMECYERAISLFEKAHRTKDVITVSLNLADTYQLNGKLPKAAEYYRYALFLCDSLNENRNRTSIYAGLANVYMELENFEMAHEYFDRVQRGIDGENYMNQLFYYISRGNCYYFEHRYGEALGMFGAARDIALRHRSLYHLTLCDGNMGEIYLMMDSLPQAHAYIEKCEQDVKQKGNTDSRVYYYMRSLQADLALAEGRYDDARRLLDFQIDSLLESTPRYLLLHYERLEHYAARYGLWQKAYEYKKKSAAYADKMRNSQIQNNVLEMGLRYQRDTTLLNQRLTLADYETRNLRQKTSFYHLTALVIVLVLAGCIIVLLARRRSKKRLRRQMEKITELRMDIVRNRVSPHYIFNVLATILPKLRHYPELVEPLEMLIDVLRGNLLTSGKMSVTLRDEIALVMQFVRLYRYSKGERPAVTWHIGAGLADCQLPVPAMSLQIPVENALKHAFRKVDDESRIDITVNHEGGRLLLQVADNGVGYDPANVPRTNRDTGTGLLLLSRTIAILNNYNGPQALFEIVNREAPEHGTRITLCIPDGYSFSLPGKNE